MKKFKSQKIPQFSIISGYSQKTNTKEDLPYPYVCYPAFNGAFIGFKKTMDSPMYFCECNKEAILNYTKLHFYSDDSNISKWQGIDFPPEIWKSLNEQKPIEFFEYAKNLCHLCNNKIPRGDELDEVNFGLQFFIYRNMLRYKYGIILSPWKIIREKCPADLLDLIETDKALVWAEVRKLNPSSTELLKLKKEVREKIDEMMNPVFRQDNKIRSYIENELRLKYGLKEIGDFWSSETKLYEIIKEIFPDDKIERHFRLSYLKGLELDIFIEKLKIGIEYQGKQHFEPVDFFGGIKSHEKLKKRDETKQKLCDSLGVSLIYFTHDEEITLELVKKKLCIE